MPMRIYKFLFVVVMFQYSILSYGGEANVAALMLVQQAGLGKNLGPITLQAASNTQTFKALSRRNGEAKIKAAVENEVSTLQPKYQVQWDKNLADSYAEFFTVIELKSIMEEGSSSQYFPKVIKRKNDVSKSMQLRSQRLIVDFVSKVMLNVNSQFANSN